MSLRVRDEEILLRHRDARLRISPRGAEALEWRAAGLDLLWRGPGAHWDSVAPVLFPTVGWCKDQRALFDGRSYPMPVHGFAARSPFEVVETGVDHATLQLCDSAATRAHYPFSFRLSLRYRLAACALDVEIEVANTDCRPLPYACGLHPGFGWPFAGGRAQDYRIVFDEPEDARIPEIAPGGLISARSRTLALRGRELPLEPRLFAREALCFLDARSRGLRFERIGGPSIVMRSAGYRHWALWSRPGAQFLCVEAWTGHGDPEDFSGEFADKPSMLTLEPGASATHALRLAVEAS